MEKLAAHREYEEFEDCDMIICNHCFHLIPENCTGEEMRMLENLCTGMEWICNIRQNQIKGYKIYWDRKTLMFPEKYLDHVQKILANENFTLLKKIMILNDFNRDIKSENPLLKTLCDSIEELLVKDIVNHLSEVDLIGVIPMTKCGKEFYNEYTYTCSENEKYFPDLEKISDADSRSDTSELSEISEISDLSVEEGRDTVDTFTSPTLTADDIITDILSNSNCVPCAFCINWKKRDSIKMDCSANQEIDCAKYELLSDMPPLLHTSSAWQSEILKGFCLKNYQVSLNKIFSVPYFERAAYIMLIFNNSILLCFPHMKKYVVMYEAIILKALCFVNSKYSKTFMHVILKNIDKSETIG